MNNYKGSLFMVLAMAAFSLEDMLIKAANATVPAGQILAIFGLVGTLAFMALTLYRQEKILHPAIMSKPILAKVIFEIMGRLGFTLAITLTPLSSASAILQATPLVVVAGSAIFFGERVGWRRWTAIAIGFFGVLLIIRPGFEGFVPASIFAIIGTLGFAGRDLATRAAPPVLSNMQLGVYGFFILVPVGWGMMLFSGDVAVLPSIMASAQIAGVCLFGVLAYYALTVAMRTGEISVVAPFRYTRLIFALILAALVFGERPDALTLLGSAIIVSGGIYTLLRNRQVAAASQSAKT